MQAEPSTPLRPAEAPGFRVRAEHELLAFLQRERATFVSVAPDAVVLLDELLRIVRAGGKRIRPTFCYWGHRAAGGTDDAAVARAAAALELLHTFAVIHDDVIDRSRLRRGEPTTFRRLAEAHPGTDAERERFGHSAAVLAGDLAQALADQLLVESGAPSARIVAALGQFNRMRTQAVAGEFLDLRSSTRGTQDRAGASRVAALKSASYTVVGPLLVGASLAGGSPDLLAHLEAFGWPLGEAFQLRDDILGTFGDPSLTGKDHDTDIREGKQTDLVVRARELADVPTRRLLDERLGRRGLTAEDVDGVRRAIRGSGALDATRARIAELIAAAEEALAAAGLAADVARGLGELARALTVEA